MFNATVREVKVPWRQVCTHWEGWGKVHGELLHCRLTAPVEYVLAEFSQYWNEFVEREGQDDGSEAPIGIYAELQASGYPPLDVMLKSHPSLFSAVVLETLQTEFTGNIISSPRLVAVGEPAYFLQSMSSLSVAEASVIIEGNCCEFIKPEP